MLSVKLEQRGLTLKALRKAVTAELHDRRVKEALTNRLLTVIEDASQLPA